MSAFPQKFGMECKMIFVQFYYFNRSSKFCGGTKLYHLRNNLVTAAPWNGNCTAGTNFLREKKSICQIALTIDPSGKMHPSLARQELEQIRDKWVKMSVPFGTEKNLLLSCTIQ